ncbi:hypothetical protein ACH6CV_14325 [Bacillota bacterium Meth-B3]
MQDRRNPLKEYLRVRVDCEPDGRMIPLAIYPDEGGPEVIDKVLDVREAPSLKMGGQGVRYTCRMRGQEIYLFCDRGQWFMEG